MDTSVCEEELAYSYTVAMAMPFDGIDTLIFVSGGKSLRVKQGITRLCAFWGEAERQKWDYSVGWQNDSLHTRCRVSKGFLQSANLS